VLSTSARAKAVGCGSRTAGFSSKSMARNLLRWISATRADNRRCVNIDHLFAGTRKENMEDAVRKGRTSHAPRACGEKHGRAVLTEAAVKEIRDLRSSGYTLAYIASMFSTSIANVHRIVHNKLWR
jgi:hypothetical protein